MLKYRITISLREFTKAVSLNICVPVSLTNQNNPANIYLFKSSNRSNRKSDEVCSNLMINTPEQCHWYVACIFTVTFEYISKHNVLYCWFWACICLPVKQFRGAFSQWYFDYWILSLKHKISCSKVLILSMQISSEKLSCLATWFLYDNSNQQRNNYLEDVLLNCEIITGNSFVRIYWIGMHLK